MRTVAAGVVLLLAAVSGCSSSDAAPAEVGPLASATATAQPSGVSTPAFPNSAASPSETSVGPAVGSGQEPPPAALAATPKGASAFTKYFFSAVNAAYRDRDAAVIENLSAPQCNSCISIVEDVERLAKAGIRVDGTRFKLQYAEAAPAEPDGSIIVDFRFSSDAYVERLANGTQGDVYPASEASDGQARLVRTGGRWLLSGLRLVEEA